MFLYASVVCPLQVSMVTLYDYCTGRGLRIIGQMAKNTEITAENTERLTVHWISCNSELLKHLAPKPL